MARWDTIIGLISGVFGGGVTAFFSWLSTRSSSDVNRHEVIYSNTDNLAHTLRETVNQLTDTQTENAKLRAQIIELQYEIKRLNQLIEEIRKGTN